jgi:hypothetical protein
MGQGGAPETRRVPEPARDIDGRRQGLTMGSGLGAVPSHTEGDQQIAAQLLVGAVVRHEHGQRALVVCGRLLEGEVRERAVAGLARVADRLRLVAHLRRREPVMCQLVDARLRLPAAQLLQRFTDAAMYA